MARYNSVNATGSIAGGNSITTPSSGLLTTLTGAGTVTIPNPVLYTGSTQTYYNSTAAVITLSTPGGVINGPGLSGGATTLSLPAGSIITLVSDGINYLTQDWVGGNISATTLSASNAVNLSPATGAFTINPTTAGNMNNVAIGGSTAAAGAFTTGTFSTSVGITTVSPRTEFDLSAGRARFNSYLAIGKGPNNNDGLFFNITPSLDGTAYTPGYIGTSGAGSAYIGMPSGGNGGLVVRVKRHGTTATAYNEASMTLSASWDDSGNTTLGGSTSNAYGTNPLYVHKDTSNIGNGFQESLAAAIFGKATATGETSVFIGADQGTTRYGYIGAVNKASAYTGLILQPAGGNVGIGNASLTPSSLLHISSSAASILNVQSTTAGQNANISFQSTQRQWYIGVNCADSNTGFLEVYDKTSSVNRLRIDSSGHMYPGTDNAQNLGSTANRWANIYTADMHFSNENTEGNSVDGTTGNWTLQEGENDIYMLNNKTGKRYKIKLEEL